MKSVNCTWVSNANINMPAPAVRAYFYIPRIDYGCNTTFIIDTGSEITCLHGQLAYKLQTQYKFCDDKLFSASGVGGSQDYYLEDDCILIFRNLNDTSYFETKNTIQLAIQYISKEDAKDGDKMSLENLLGRDILSHGDFVFNPPDSKVSLCFPDGNTKNASRQPI